MPVETVPPPVATPAPVVAPTPAPAKTEDHPFAELDTAWKTVETAPKETPKAEPKPELKAEEPKPEPQKAAPDKPRPVFKEPKELRAELDRVNGELKSRTENLTKLESRIKELESKGQDASVLIERAATLEKQMDELRSENRMLKQESSPEFKEKYDKPFDQAADYTKQLIEQLQVTEGDTVRPAKWDDFVAIFRLPYSKAIASAKDMFGDGSQLVLNHLSELHRLEHVRNVALKEEKDNAARRTKDEEAQHLTRREEINSMWSRANKELSEREEYRDPPEDKELAELRNKGYSSFDAETRDWKQRVVKDAHIRQRVAAFGPNQLMIKRLQSKLATLEKENETLKNPQPKAGKRAVSPADKGDDGLSWEEAARKHLT